MMVPIHALQWYRMQCYDGTDSCATVVPIRRYCHVGTFLPIEKQTPSGAYQGAKYFSCKGKVLDELRKEKEL